MTEELLARVALVVVEAVTALFALLALCAVWRRRVQIIVGMSDEVEKDSIVAVPALLRSQCADDIDQCLEDAQTLLKEYSQ